MLYTFGNEKLDAQKLILTLFIYTIYIAIKYVMVKFKINITNMRNLMSLSDVVVADYKTAFDKTPSTCSLEQFLMDVQNCKYQELIQRVRDAYAAYISTNNDEDKNYYEKVKMYLPCIKVAGVFGSNTMNSFVAESNTNIKIMDFDDVADDVETLDEFKLKFAEDVHTLFVFTSPSNNGLKVGIRLKYNHTSSKYNKESFVNYYKGKFGLDFCEKAFPWHFNCFYSADEKLVVKNFDEVEPFDCVKFSGKKSGKKSSKDVSVAPDESSENLTPGKDPFKEKMKKKVLEILNSCGPKNRFDKVRKAGMMIGGGLASGLYNEHDLYEFEELVLQVAREHLRTFYSAIEAGKNDFKGEIYVPREIKVKSNNEEVVENNGDVDAQEVVDFSIQKIGETPKQRWIREEKLRKSKCGFYMEVGSNVIIDDEKYFEYLEALPIATERDDTAIKFFYHVTQDELIPFQKSGEQSEHGAGVLSIKQVDKAIAYYMRQDGVNEAVISKILSSQKKFHDFKSYKYFRSTFVPTKKKNTIYFNNCYVTVKKDKIVVKNIDTRFVSKSIRINKYNFKLKNIKKMSSGPNSILNMISGFCSDKINGEWVLNEPKLEYFLWTIGKYMTTCHDGWSRADDGSGKQCLYVIDNHVGKSKGGTAKSAFIRMFTSILNAKPSNGKDLDKRFPLDGYIPEWHQVLSIQDAEPDVVKIFYNYVGESQIEFNAKHKTKSTLEGDELPNIYISSNYLPHDYILEGDTNLDWMNSTNRRTDLIIISDYWKVFNHNLSNSMVLKWETESEWNEFFNDMLFLMQEFMKNPNMKRDDWEYNSLDEVKGLLGKSSVEPEVIDFMRSYIRRKDRVEGKRKIKGPWRDSNKFETRRICDWELLVKTFFEEHPETEVSNKGELYKQIQKYFMFFTDDRICGRSNDYRGFYYEKIGRKEIEKNK